MTEGPASFTEMALPRNSPVPIVQPRPIIATWWGFSSRRSPDSRCTTSVECAISAAPFST